MKYFFTYILLLFSFPCLSQFTDNFSDGEFTSGPTWIGDDSVFTVVDDAGNFRLRSNKLIPSTSFYLATPNNQAIDGQWEFYVNLKFQTSSANYVDIYLTADQSNLLSATLSGYFVRIGGTTDEISLFKKVSGVSTKIIDGVDGQTNTSDNKIKIKVTCSATNDWKLERDLSGLGTSFFTEGTINDATLTTSSYFGVAVTQSTVSFIQKHYFDDFYVGPIILDITPPVLLSATAISDTQVDVLFNEPMDPITSQDPNNYDIIPFQSATSAVLDGSNPNLVHLTMASPLANGNVYTLTIFIIEDVAGNSSGTQSVNFQYIVAEIPSPGDVIINEFICDQTPSVGLPEVEYVEIYNKSAKYFDLNDWKLGDASADGTITQAWLAPGEYKVLCSTSNVDTFDMTVPVGVTSFPSLNNSGDDIVLKDNNGVILDKISYTDQWYKDPSKADGGYSIELINPFDPCSGEDNWRASEAAIGGTPGSVNSVFDATPDSDLPEIEIMVPESPNILTIHFSEGMDSTSLANALISLSTGLTVQSVIISGPYPDSMTIVFIENLVPSQTYSITLSSVSDCWGNSTNVSGSFVLPDQPILGDIIINEIMYDPLTGGSDWIEVYNRSDKLIDLKNWQVANYEDTIANIKTVEEHFYLLPGAYAVLGKDSTFVMQNYPATVPGTFVYMELPSFNNDSGTVYLIYSNFVLDKVSYTADWHFPLLDVTDGVSLERLDPNGPSDDQNNWHSAAEAIGFATPGGKNSQFYPAVLDGNFHFTSQTISPDNDGFEDVLQINYQMSEAGLLGKLSIYDDRGRIIKDLFSNELLGTSGTFVWDGVTDKNVKAGIGTYVAVFEAFSLSGDVVFTGTKVLVVAGKL